MTEQDALKTALQARLDQQKQAFKQDPMPSAAARKQHLKALRQALLAHQQPLIEAISADFSHRAADETRMAELLPCLLNIDYTLKHLERWLKPSKRKVALAFQPASAQVVYQPVGVVGIIVPWNYPLFLAIGPLIGALAAGNRAMLKLSEATPNTSALIKQLLKSVFTDDHVSVVLGDVDTAIAFSELAFDHLLFTGSSHVGRQVMHAAAANLTPVTLELGGKSPAIIGQDAEMLATCERIAFGKTLNAGQTCVAPDYVLVPHARLEEFVDTYSQVVRRFYPSLVDNPDYTAIINTRQLQRLEDYLTDAKAHGARILSLYPQGQGRRMPHALVLDVNEHMRLMQEEIFGPLLPVVPYQSLDQALDYVQSRPRPLALYYFGHTPDEQARVLSHTHSGGVCINDALLHVAQEDLPFGGIGASGMGAYHGHEGFLTFSHAKAVFSKGRFNAARLIYPPYGGLVQRLVQKFLLR